MSAVAGSGPLSGEALGEIVAQFPVLRRRVDGHPLTYLDSAATSQTQSSAMHCIGSPSGSHAMSSARISSARSTEIGRLAIWLRSAASVRASSEVIMSAALP